MLGEAHVEATIPVFDLKLGRQFYEGVLGLKLVGSLAPDVDVIYECGQGSRVVIYEMTTMAAAAHTVAHFIVDDVHATVRDLRARGVVFEEYDFAKLKTVDGVASVRGVDFAWFKDPDRNVLGIHN